MRGLPRLPLRGDRRPRSQPSWNRHNKGGQRGGKNSPQAVSDLSCLSMSRRRGKPRLYSKGQLTASAWPPLPNPRRVPARLRPGRQPPEESEPVAAARRRSSSAWALRPAAALFRPKAAERRRARPQLPFPAGSVQVPFVVKLHTHFSCLGTCVLEQGIKRRVWVSPALCQGKQAPRVQRWSSKHHDGDQDPQDQDDERQQIDGVPQPRFSRGHCVSKEGRHEFLLHRSRRGRRCVLRWLAVRDLALLLLPRLLRGILLFAIEAERSPLGNGESAGSTFFHPEHSLRDGSWNWNWERRPW